MKRTRLVEGLVVVVVLALLFVSVSGASDLGSVLSRANPALYGLSFVGALAWLLASSETLFVLLETQHADLGWLRFRLVFLGGMGLRGLVPGGSVSGPPVLAYVVTTSTPVESEGSLAMAFVAELCYWLGSVSVAALGLVGLAFAGDGTTVPAPLVGGLAALTVLLGTMLALGIRNPTLVERPAHAVAFAGRSTVGRVSTRVRDALAPDAVDRRLERFFDALGHLSDDPRHLLPALGWSVLGWLCHALALYATLLALGLSVSPFVALFVVPVGGISEGLSLFPGGLGSVESSQTLLLVVLTGAGLGVVGVAVLLYRLSSYWFRIALGAVCLFYLGVSEPFRNDIGVD